jgi:hypothetical protein
MGAEKSLIDTTIVGAGERTTPLGQLLNGGWGLARQDLGNPRITKQVALFKSVGEVLLPRVLRIASTEGGVDPAGSQHGMSIEASPLADDHDLGASLMSGNRSPQPGSSRADHENVCCMGSYIAHSATLFFQRRSIKGVNPIVATRANPTPSACVNT